MTLKSLSCRLLGSHVKYGASVCVSVCVLWGHVCILWGHVELVLYNPSRQPHQHVVKHLLQRNYEQTTQLHHYSNYVVSLWSY